MLGVLLAAGRGTRLMPITAEKPKALVEVGRGLTLLELSVRSLLASGLRELVVVVGHLGEAVRRAALALSSYGAEIHVVENPEYWRGNGLSLLRAWDVVGSDEFLLAMCDHLVEPAIYEGAARAGIDSALVLTGVASLEDVKRSTAKPRYVLRSLLDMFE